MIQYIYFDHYRIFSDKQCLRIAPLTVVFGKNNTGKSAVIKLPMLLHSAIQCKDDNVFMKDIYGTELCEEYRDVVFGKGNHAVNIEVCDELSNNSLSVKFVVENRADGAQSKIEEITINYRDSILVAKLDDNGALIVEGTGEKVSFKGLSPQEEKYREWTELALKDLDVPIDYIGPVRCMPERYFRLNEKVDGRSGPDGRNAYTYLVKDSQNTIHPLLDLVSEWYSDNFDGWRVEVNNSRAPIYSIELTNERVHNNLKETGFGIQQSLPIVVAAYRKYETPTLIVIEEPESHLNPSAHAQIGELLAKSALNDRNKKFLVETHSLNLMIRLRTLIAKGVLKREDVALYYVDYNESSYSSRIIEVGIDERGDVSDWPVNMFNETLNEALALRQAQVTKR